MLLAKLTSWHNAPHINADAVFIADAHFMCFDTNKSADSNLFSKQALKAQNLLLALTNLQHNPPSQIFLMGDIAHILVGHINASVKANIKLLESIEKLSSKSEVWWFEGNHDLGLNAISSLSRIHIITRKYQPYPFYFQHKRTLLAHGDIFLPLKYEMYIRSLNASLKALRLLDNVTFGNLYTYLANRINHQHINEGDIDVIPFAKSRIQSYQRFSKKHFGDSVEMIIEGHFHIGKSYKDDKVMYICLPSFYICRSIYRVKLANLEGMLNV